MNKLQIGNFILNIFPDFEERLRDWIIKSDLTEREKYVLIQRIFNEKTLEKVGKEAGVTRERIRQIEAKGYRKLRHPMYRNAFKDDFRELSDSDIFHSYRRAFYDSLFDEEEARKETYAPLKAVLDEQEERYQDSTFIEELELSVRTYNVLKRSNINTLKDLSRYSIADLWGLRNMGKKGIDEILEKTKDITLFKLREEQVDDN